MAKKKPIKITYYSEIVDNWGRKEASFKGDIIFSVLNDVENWNDDMIFEGEDRQIYFISDLAGKEVLVDGVGIFTVPTDENGE